MLSYTPQIAQLSFSNMTYYVLCDKLTIIRYIDRQQQQQQQLFYGTSSRTTLVRWYQRNIHPLTLIPTTNQPPPADSIHHDPQHPMIHPTHQTTEQKMESSKETHTLDWHFRHHFPGRPRFASCILSFTTYSRSMTSLTSGQNFSHPI